MVFSTTYIVVYGRVTTIYPVQDQTALQDYRVMSLIQYAKKVEKSMFEMARSKVSVCVYKYVHMHDFVECINYTWP